MRRTGILYLPAILLFIAAIALVGLLEVASSLWELWLLRGAVVVVCIGIFLSGRLIQVKEQGTKLREELSASEARFQAFFNDPAVGIGILGLDRRLVDANPTLFRIFGRTREEMVGMNSAEITYPDDDPVSAKLFVELLNGQRDSYESDRRYIRKSGEVFWAHVTMSIVRGPDNKPLYLVGVVMDVDKQKRDALALQESQARFQAIFNSAAVGVGIVGLDRRVIDANPAICRMFGVTREDLIGMNPTESTFPEDDPSSIQLFNELASGQRDAYETDRRYIRKNGEVFWVHVTMSSVCGSDNKPLYLVGMLMDVDAQKRNALALEESEARFQALFDNLAVGIAVTSLDGKPIAFNPVVEKITGYSLEDISRIDSRLLIAPEDWEKDRELFNELLEGKRRSYTTEVRYRHKNNQIVWARINYSLVRDLTGKPDYLVIIIEDINEQKNSADALAAQEAQYLLTLQQRVRERTYELEEANQRLKNEIEQRARIEKELAEKAALEAVAADRTSLARDLHDAVTQTLFSSSLIAEVLPDLWEMDADEARRSTEELRQLTRGALAEMRTMLLELRPSALMQTHLKDLIAQLCEAFIGRTRLPINMKIEGDRELPPEVQIAIYRIAQESLNNILKYARATEVSLSLFMDSEMVRFKVCDNGIGFDLSASKPMNFGSRIMRERAEAIGADFQITSAPGAGTSVEVTWNENPNLKL